MRLGEVTNDADLLQACEEARMRRHQIRRGQETIWWNNISLLSGDHFSEWNPLKGEIIQRQPTDERVRIVVNHALTVARTELSKLTKSRPLMTVMASTDEADDIAATKVALHALDAMEWKFQLAKLRKNALWWMIPCGIAAIYVGWDPSNSKDGHAEYTLDPTTGDPVFAPGRITEIRQMVEEGTLDEEPMERVPLGDLCYKVFSGFQLLPEETAADFRELQDLITTEIIDIDVARNIWGKAADKLNPEQTFLGTIERMMVRKLTLGPVTSPSIKNAVNIHTQWILPGKWGNSYLKGGLMMRWSQGQIMEIMRPFPYDDGRMPFAFFQHIPTSTTIWPESILTHIRGMNLEIDKIMSQMVETKDHMSNPQWLVATQHQIVGKIKNKPGGIIRYVHVRDIPPPQPIQGLQLPPQVQELMLTLRSQIMEISGQSEPTRGQMPQNVRSGVQIAYLQEEDDSKIAPTIEEMEWATAYMSSLTLSRMAQYYTTERTLSVYRKNGIYDVKKFQGANLKGNTQVIPIVGSGMPKSKAARQEYILQLAQMGLLRDPRMITEALELGQGEPTDLDRDYSQATRENNIMLYGLGKGLYGEENKLPTDPQGHPTAIPVKTWHNHQVHLEVHHGLMKSEDFDKLAMTNAEIVRLFDEHCAMHEQIIQQQQQQQLQMMMAARGMPDGPPGQASQPGMDAGNGPAGGGPAGGGPGQ